MIVIVSAADPDRERDVVAELARLGVRVAAVARSEGRVLLSVAPEAPKVDLSAIRSIAGVEDVAVTASKHPCVDAATGPVRIGEVVFGAGEPVLVAGPCAVESEAQIHRLAEAVARAGARVLRGGVFKPRTSPHSFQGVGAQGLGWMRRAADHAGLSLVTEVLSEADVDVVAEAADALQVGSRTMQSAALLRRVGGAGLPVVLKRAMSATIEEWLLSAEALLVSGAAGVVLCERGVRGFDPALRNLLDLGAVALLAQTSGLPVLVDPSHAAGRRDLVVPLARAGLAAGAAGVMIEVHDAPAEARSDGAQALDPAELFALGFTSREGGGAAQPGARPGPPSVETSSHRP